MAELSVAKAGIVVLLCILVFRVLQVLYSTGRRENGLPPGPNTKFLVGNTLQYPINFPHVKFFEWAKLHGDIFSLKLFNRTVVVVSSAKLIRELLDQKGARTGDRPQSYIAHRITSGDSMAFANLDSITVKRGRKSVRDFLTEEALNQHLRTQEIELTTLMHDILADPFRLYHHAFRSTISVMSSLLYGRRALAFEGTHAEAMMYSVKALNEALDIGANPPVDLIWPLRYVPERWAAWKRRADHVRTIRNGIHGQLYDQCEREIREGRFNGSYIESLILSKEQAGMTRDEIIGQVSTVMDAGAETSATFLHNFVLALINNPHVQEKGQKELDQVIGQDRFPALADYEQLPYVRAIAEEVHRFRPILPIGLPHANPAEVDCTGYRIPKESTIFINVYGLYHNEEMFQDPETFDPERYLRTTFGTRPSAPLLGLRNNIYFGAGRRICPGEPMARRTIALNTMYLLWAFNFEKDASGTGSYELDAYSKPGVELAPKPFTCEARPRSEKKAAMIRDRYSEVQYAIHA